MKAFTEFGLAPTLIQAIADLGFTEPTPVQSKVIPLLLKNARDVVALAQTGTGKTAAYGLPLLHLTDAASDATQALILCPTRELCLQIAGDLTDFCKHTRGIRILAVYGGSPIDAQIRALSRGVQIIVATPGRMNDLLRRKRARLATVQRVVLDEADEMLKMGFMEDLETILNEVPDTARTLLFSATMPRQVAAIAGKYMDDPEEILIGQRNSGSANVSHEYYMVHAKDRYPALKRIIDFHRDMYGIVFCRTRLDTQDVAAQLMEDGYNADALHGDLSQAQRDRVMKTFRDRHLQILVATDVAARGLDVNDLTHVINYSLPDDLDGYTHRSGRTGRAGKEGISIAIVNMREEFKIRIIERGIKKQFEHKSVPSGQEVCNAQLAGMLDRIKQIDAKDARIEPYMTTIHAAFADMSKDEIIRRFILKDADRILTYYKDAPNLNATHSHHDRGQDRNPRSSRDHAGRGVQGPREYGGRPGSGRDRAPGSAMTRLRINLGLQNELTPTALISVINRATRGPMLRVGRIQIMDQASVFEVSSEDAQVLLPSLNRSKFEGRAVEVVAEDGQGPVPSQGASHRPAHRPPYAPRSQDDSRSGPRRPPYAPRTPDRSPRRTERPPFHDRKPAAASHPGVHVRKHHGHTPEGAGSSKR